MSMPAAIVNEMARTEVFFLVDGKRLEAQACLLAGTLLRHLGPGQRAVAYVRSDYAPQLEPLTREVLDKAGIALRIMPGTEGGHAPWRAPYPQGNKILAAALARDCAVSVFLDTDTVMVRPVDFAAMLGADGIAAVVSDYAIPATDVESWREHYAMFGLGLPEERVTLHAGRRLTVLPYFNAGVVLWREKDAGGAPTGIGAAWLTMAVRFDAERQVPDRSFIDQITLPILGHTRNMPVKTLPQRMNFNIQAFGSAAADQADIAHYHNIGVLWAHPEHGLSTLRALQSLIGRDGIDRYVATFFVHLKRSRMKAHLAALAMSGDTVEG
jgi:hypothetical protein